MRNYVMVLVNTLDDDVNSDYERCRVTHIQADSLEEARAAAKADFMSLREEWWHEAFLVTEFEQIPRQEWHDEKRAIYDAKFAKRKETSEREQYARLKAKYGKE